MTGYILEKEISCYTVPPLITTAIYWSQAWCKLCDGMPSCFSEGINFTTVDLASSVKFSNQELRTTCSLGVHYWPLNFKSAIF